IALVALGEGRVARGAGKQITVWNIKSGRCEHEQTLKGHMYYVYALVALGEGRLASGSYDKTIKVWDVKSGRCEQTLIGHTDTIRVLVALGEGRVASGSEDNTIKLWTLPPSLQLTKTEVVSASANAGTPTPLLSSSSVEHKDDQPAVPATEKAGDYSSQAAGLQAFGSKALHHSSSTSGNVSQNAASASASAKTPKLMPMG